MRIKNVVLGASVALMMASLASAQSMIEVHDPYARSSRPNAPTGAAFMVLVNKSETDDRLVSARSDIAKRVELHTHKENADGVMAMVEIKEGIAVPAGSEHALQRGGDHVMFMGLNQDLVQGERVKVTLVFEKAGEIVVEIPVDLERKPMAHGHGSGG